MHEHNHESNKELAAERIGQAVEQATHRTSSARKLLIDTLTTFAGEGRGFTAEQLWYGLRSQNDKIGRATVFRAVKLLVDSGVLDFIDFSDGLRLYRVCGERMSEGGHHHHLACVACRSIREFHFCLSEEQLQEIGDSEHFTIQGHSLTVFGLCENCAKKA